MLCMPHNGSMLLIVHIFFVLQIDTSEEHSRRIFKEGKKAVVMPYFCPFFRPMCLYQYSVINFKLPYFSILAHMLKQDVDSLNQQ